MDAYVKNEFQTPQDRTRFRALLVGRLLKGHCGSRTKIHRKKSQPVHPPSSAASTYINNGFLRTSLGRGTTDQPSNANTHTTDMECNNLTGVSCRRGGGGTTHGPRPPTSEDYVQSEADRSTARALEIAASTAHYRHPQIISTSGPAALPTIEKCLRSLRSFRCRPWRFLPFWRRWHNRDHHFLSPLCMVEHGVCGRLGGAWGGGGGGGDDELCMCHIDLTTCFWSLRLPEASGGLSVSRMVRGEYFRSGACPLAGSIAPFYATRC